MAIDSGIYGAIQQPQAFNPLAEMAQFQQLQGIQNQNKLAELTLQKDARAQADLTAQRGILAGGLTGPDLENALLNGGFIESATKLGTDRRANEKSDIETQAKKVETATKRLEVIGQGLGYLKDNPSFQNAQAVLSNFVQTGLMDEATAQKKLAEFQADPSPQGIQRLATIGYQGALSAKDQLPKIDTLNLGGTMQTQAVSPVTGQVRPLASAPITQSADNIASNAQSNINSQRSTSASMANAAAVRDTAQATRDAASINARANSETDLRKEFAGLPEVKKYKEAIPAYSAVVKASKVNNPQADINLIYGLAKLYDPESVVREGEYDTIARSQAIPEWIKGQAQRLVGGGRLTEATKAQIREQAKIRLDSYKSEVDGARGSYEQVARGRGFSPENIFPAIGGQLEGAAPAVRRYNPATGRLE